MIKKMAVLVAATVAVLTVSSAAVADYQMSSGSSGSGNGKDYAYEIWSNEQNTAYTLKVWLRANYPNSSPWIHTFRSSTEAFNYFDCNYAQKSLPSCPK